jgi:hypothetical protein
MAFVPYDPGSQSSSGGSESLVGYLVVIREIFEAALMIKNQRILIDHYVRFEL